MKVEDIVNEGLKMMGRPNVALSGQADRYVQTSGRAPILIGLTAYEWTTILEAVLQAEVKATSSLNLKEIRPPEVYLLRAVRDMMVQAREEWENREGLGKDNTNG